MDVLVMAGGFGLWLMMIYDDGGAWCCVL